MKKIPTLFVRTFENNHKHITEEVTPGCEMILQGEGVPTVKWDGTCCAVIGGVFYKRYDAKKNTKGKYKNPPEGAIPCCDPDPVTGHWPHWVKVSETAPEDKWFREAYKNTIELLPEGARLTDWTYEAVGPHFNDNPYNEDGDRLIAHGTDIIKDLTDRSFTGIRDYLKSHEIEGIVFWKDGEPVCKIKRTDFGFKWPVK